MNPFLKKMGYTEDDRVLITHEDDMGFSDGVFCLLPLAIIAGTVAAFVRGNRGLGFGMLTSLGLMVLIPFLFLFFILTHRETFSAH